MKIDKCIASVGSRLINNGCLIRKPFLWIAYGDNPEFQHVGHAYISFTLS